MGSVQNITDKPAEIHKDDSHKDDFLKLKEQTMEEKMLEVCKKYFLGYDVVINKDTFYVLLTKDHRIYYSISESTEWGKEQKIYHLEFWIQRYATNDKKLQQGLIKLCREYPRQYQLKGKYRDLGVRCYLPIITQEDLRISLDELSRHIYNFLKISTLPVDVSKTTSEAYITNVEGIFHKELVKPNYQRPYKWSEKNVKELLYDIDDALEKAERLKDYRYRIGTIILHKEKSGKLNVVDGQQRLITLSLIYYFLGGNEFENSILSFSIENPTSRSNIIRNYSAIVKWFAGKDSCTVSEKPYKEKMKEAFHTVLELVVITVPMIDEAFQLFDTQNSRGKPLDPHDLLKAYHLREMRDCEWKMRSTVERWEAIPPAQIRSLFQHYLFPIHNWIQRCKTHDFSNQDIDCYKGVPSNSSYPYAERVRSAVGFQINQLFMAGEDFFLMTLYYLQMIKYINEVLPESIKNLKEQMESKYGNGKLTYAWRLFECALLAYYDRFGNFDALAVKNLFVWAMQIRCEMDHLLFPTINNYAIGNRYPNDIPLFWKIAKATRHNEISALTINTVKNWQQICKD